MADSSGSSKKAGWGGKIISFIPVLILVAIVILTFRSCSADYEKAVTPARANSTSAVAGKSSATAPVGTYVIAIPEGGAVDMPAKDVGWSEGIHVPSGFTLCRDAQRGRDSFLAQFRDQSVSDEWKTPSTDSTGNEERYQSKGEAQKMTYHFVPQSASC